MTRYFASINGRYCNNGLNAEISNIKCPICGQKMDVVRIEREGNDFDCNREIDRASRRVLYTETVSSTSQIKWRCQYCTAELSATAKEYCETTKDLDADI